MRDHFIVLEDGSRYKVAELPLADLVGCLMDGVDVTEDDGATCTEEDIMERLRIEFLIRKMGW
jgi:hypothetical protein